MVNERSSLRAVARELIEVPGRNGCSKSDGVAVGIDDVRFPGWLRTGNAACEREELLEGDGEGALEGWKGGLGELEDGALWEVVEEKPLHRAAEEPRDVEERERENGAGNLVWRRRDSAPVDDFHQVSSLFCHVDWSIFIGVGIL